MGDSTVLLRWDSVLSLLLLLLCVGLGLGLGFRHGGLLLMHSRPCSLLCWHTIDRRFLSANCIRIDVIDVGIIEWGSKVDFHVSARHLGRGRIEIESVIDGVGAKITIGVRIHALSLTVDYMVVLVDGESIGQGADWESRLLLVEFVLMTRAGKRLLTWSSKE